MPDAPEPSRKSFPTMLPDDLIALIKIEEEQWARDTNLDPYLDRLAPAPKTRAKLGELARLFYGEGFYRGAFSVLDFRPIGMAVANARLDALDRVAELEALFELQHAADQRAVALWRAAHPGCDNVFPDRTCLVTWLMQRLDALGGGVDGGSTIPEGDAS